jgi:hypothetical protein
MKLGEKMKKHRIPVRNLDLRKYAVWKNLKYLLGYVAYIAFFFSAFVYYVQHRPEDADALLPWVYPIFAGFVVVSGWIACCMDRFVFDHSMSGAISGTAFVRNYGRGLSRKATVSVDFHTYLKIDVTNEKGRKRSVKIPLFDDGYDGYYQENGTLVKFRGLTYPICIESEREGAHLCCICGVRTYYKEGKQIFGEAEPEIVDGLIKCRCCNHTLIDIDELVHE